MRLKYMIWVYFFWLFSIIIFFMLRWKFGKKNKFRLEIQNQKKIIYYDDAKKISIKNNLVPFANSIYFRLFVVFYSIQMHRKENLREKNNSTRKTQK